ncbi:MAG: topology modulation protein [Sphingomonas sp.]
MSGPCRIMIVGAPGSGKSTLARLLGERLGLPVYHLDQLYHRPGWTPPPPGEFEADVARIAALPAWVIDGNYSSAAEPRLRVADLLIHVDVSTLIRLTRILRRIATYAGRVRPDSAPGCPERLDWEFLVYAWRWQRDVGPRVRAVMASFTGPVVTLRTAADRTSLLAALGGDGEAPSAPGIASLHGAA